MRIAAGSMLALLMARYCQSFAQVMTTATFRISRQRALRGGMIIGADGYLSCRTGAVGTDQRFIRLAGVGRRPLRTRNEGPPGVALGPPSAPVRDAELCRGPGSPLGPGGPAGPSAASHLALARRSCLALRPRLALRPWCPCLALLALVAPPRPLALVAPPRPSALAAWFPFRSW